MLQSFDFHIKRQDVSIMAPLSFTLTPGSFLLLTGANGSGKTSILRALAGLLSFEGRLCFKHLPIEQSDFYQSIAYLGHKNALKDSLTVIENCLYGFMNRAVTTNELVAVLRPFELHKKLNITCKSLSEGQKRKLALARLVLMKQSIWLLDEPTNVLDSAGIIVVESLIKTHLASGGYVIASSHRPLLAGYHGGQHIAL